MGKAKVTDNQELGTVYNLSRYVKARPNVHTAIFKGGSSAKFGLASILLSLRRYILFLRGYSARDGARSLTRAKIGRSGGSIQERFPRLICDTEKGVSARCIFCSSLQNAYPMGRYSRLSLNHFEVIIRSLVNPAYLVRLLLEISAPQYERRG